MKYVSLIILATLSACVHGSLDPDLSLVDSYTYELEKKEPFNERFISRFEKDDYELT